MRPEVTRASGLESGACVHTSERRKERGVNGVIGRMASLRNQPSVVVRLLLMDNVHRPWRYCM